MRHFMLACIAALVVAGGTGCRTLHDYLVNGNKGCSDCGGHGCGKCGKAGHGHGHALGHHGFNGPVPNHDPHFYGQGHAGCQACGTAGPAGPGVVGAGFAAGPGQVTYPYYTTRGPRDFLQDDPPSIGP